MFEMKALIIAGMIATVGNDGGGAIRDYYFNMLDKYHGGFTIRFNGECRSACTLYLAIPNKCVTPNAIFKFHSPWGLGASPNQIQAARNFLMTVYPKWVKDWIKANNALKTILYTTMPYSYVIQHVKQCKVYVADGVQG
jgi:hypothetical protein